MSVTLPSNALPECAIVQRTNVYLQPPVLSVPLLQSTSLGFSSVAVPYGATGCTAVGHESLTCQNNLMQAMDITTVGFRTLKHTTSSLGCVTAIGAEAGNAFIGRETTLVGFFSQSVQTTSTTVIGTSTNESSSYVVSLGNNPTTFICPLRAYNAANGSSTLESLPLGAMFHQPTLFSAKDGRIFKKVAPQTQSPPVAAYSETRTNFAVGQTYIKTLPQQRTPISP